MIDKSVHSDVSADAPFSVAKCSEIWVGENELKDRPQWKRGEEFDKWSTIKMSDAKGEIEQLAQLLALTRRVWNIP